MKNLKFISEFTKKALAVENPTKDQMGHFYAVLHNATTGKVESNDSNLPNEQQQCYLDHAGQCGSCDAHGGWTGC